MSVRKNPRVRKNAAEMTDTEWTRFCKAVVALKHTFPAGQSEETKISVYDQFVAQHRGVRTLMTNGPSVPDGGHGGPAFLPWHREYLRRFEAALMAVDARVTLPYWNWGLADPSETDALFGDDRLGPREGKAATGAITSGYFSKGGRNELGWTIHPSLRISTEDTLQRGESWPLTSLPAMREMLSTLALPSYTDFHPELEEVCGAVRGVVGGHMSDDEISPNDPLFFLHHAQVDRLWALWQLRHPDARHYVGSSAPGQGASDNMWPWNASASAPRSGWPWNVLTSAAGSSTVAELIPTFAATDVVKPEDLLDTRKLGYIYDGEDTPREFDQTGTVVGDDWHTIRLRTRTPYRKPRQAQSPPVVAGVHTFCGVDTAGVRVRVPDDDPVGRVSFMVEEERSRDEEIGHVEESIAYLAGEEGLIYDASGRVIGELGHIHMDQRNREGRERLLYRHGHPDPVVIATISSYVGDQPAHMRLEGVGQDGCDVFIEEWTYLDHYHMREDVSYLVIASGEHRLRDGALVKAGRESVGHAWRTIQFEGAFSDAPIVFTMSQTLTRPTPVVTRQRNVGRDSFDVRLQTEERLGAPDEQEWVGWIAFGG